MLADVTFTIELSNDEATALRYVMEGKTDLQIASYMHVSPIKLKANFEGLHLENNLNLVDALRDKLVSILFHREWATRKTGT